MSFLTDVEHLNLCHHIEDGCQGEIGGELGVLDCNHN